MPKINKVDLELVKQVEWNGNGTAFDLELQSLSDESEFMIVNPWFEDQLLHHYIDDIPKTDKCVVWQNNGNWVAKYFRNLWKPNDGYEYIELVRPHLVWRKNPDLDRTMKFEEDIFGKYIPDPYESRCELVWYIDNRFNPSEDHRVWAFKCSPVGSSTRGYKDMGDVIPDINVEFNKDLPDFGLDVWDLVPPYYHLANECYYKLDHKFAPGEDVWVVKFTPAYRKPLPSLFVGTITPELQVTYNPELPKMDYGLDDSFGITWEYLKHEHIWMLDKRHQADSEKEIWAVKVKAMKNPKKKIIVNYVSPIPKEDINPDFDSTNFSKVYKYDVPYYDFKYDHIWNLDPRYTTVTDPVWAVKLRFTEENLGDKFLGTIEPELPPLDVVFISYNEPNAEDNWARLLELVPYAQRVDGVEGILQAHKAAAKLAQSDMFFVVDGDAYIENARVFDYQPDIFDRDCTFIWHSRNPVNDLEYGYGGVKLFPRKAVIKARTWKTLDFSTTVNEKIKVIETVSNINQFNVDAVTTWRSAFRECVKLYSSGTEENLKRLEVWKSTGLQTEFGKYAIAGAYHAIDFVDDCPDELAKINDRAWLDEQFKKLNE